jgi:3-deoxy-7-phosphoheptulonate synthase
MEEPNMIVTVGQNADSKWVEQELTARGLWFDRFERGGRVQLAIAPHSRQVDRDELLHIRGVETVVERVSLHPLVDAQPAVVRVGDVEVGAGRPAAIIAGPCSVESEAQIASLARVLARMGVRFLRGGAFKPRSSPYAFQGHGREALMWMRRAANEQGMKVVTEAMSAEEAVLVTELADMVQIGSRNMHNSALLKAVAKQRRPVLLKRGMAATIEEWLSAAEYALLHGAPSVIFCERGIRSFDPSTRNMLDIGAVALLAHVHRQPVLVDPSHAAGRRDLILSLSKAAIAAGASGLMIETHEDPGHAMSDGPQALLPEDLARVLEEVDHVGR